MNDGISCRRPLLLLGSTYHVCHSSIRSPFTTWSMKKWQVTFNSNYQILTNCFNQGGISPIFLCSKIFPLTFNAYARYPIKVDIKSEIVAAFCLKHNAFSSLQRVWFRSVQSDCSAEQLGPTNVWALAFWKVFFCLWTLEFYDFSSKAR